MILIFFFEFFVFFRYLLGGDSKKPLQGAFGPSSRGASFF